MKKFNSIGIKKVLDWANGVNPCQGTIGRDQYAVIPAVAQMTNIQVIAKLVAMNGFKPVVTTVGRFTGPFGLTIQEAFLLMEMTSYFQGLIDGADVGSESATNMLQPLLDGWASMFEAEGERLAATEAADSVGAAADEVKAEEELAAEVQADAVG